MHALGLSLLKDGVLYVPSAYSPERPAPFSLVLHGARGNGTRMLERLVPPEVGREALDFLLAPGG